MKKIFYVLSLLIFISFSCKKKKEYKEEFTMKVAVFYSVKNIDTIVFKSYGGLSLRSDRGTNYIWDNCKGQRIQTSAPIKLISYTVQSMK